MSKQGQIAPDQPIMDLVQSTERLADDFHSQERRREWEEFLRKLDASELVRAAGLLTSDTQHRPARIKALREAIMAEVERKNTERITHTLEHLDRAAGMLTWASFFLAFMGTALAAVQVWQGFGRH